MIRLDALCNSPRFQALNRLDSYYEGTQYSHLRYNWDGRFDGFESADISPGWFVPYSQRKPRLNLELGKRAVRRFTAMLFGDDHFPELVVENDPDATDYVQEMARVSKVAIKMLEARNRGGACGTACVSFAFVQGKPRVSVHRAKHIHVLEWADRAELRPRSALLAYSYKRQVREDGRFIERVFYYARLWDENSETVWDPISEDQAKAGTWETAVRSVRVEHHFGFVPVYLAQNRPDDEKQDGAADYDGFSDDMDEVNRLMSATSKGTIANVDPTLVIKMEPSLNNGALKKGSDNAIFSPGGAEYLELRGDSVKTAIALAGNLVERMDESMGLVVASPDQLSAARSAAAMRMLYAPMIAECSILRTQYGTMLQDLLKGMLVAARKIGNAAPGPVEQTSDGRVVQQRPTVVLEPRVVTEEVDGIQITTEVERNPGKSERVSLKWGAYFEPTPTDTQSTVDGTLKARGVLISERTAVRVTAPLFGVEDVEEELRLIREESEARAAQFAPSPDGLQIEKEPKPEPDTDDGEDSDE